MQQFIMCGRNSVIESYQNGVKIDTIYLAKESNKNLFANFKGKIIIKDNAFLDKLSEGENHQGYVALISNIKILDINYLIKNQPSKVLILDHIEDPRNLGAIIRTANAAGIKDIILSKDKSADLTPTALKTSSGGFVNMNFYKVSSISATITKMKENNYWVYATALDKKALPHTKANYNSPCAIVVGNEGKGVSKSVLSVVDQTIYIEQFGTVQSLNVSVATGIVLFDLVNKNAS